MVNNQDNRPFADQLAEVGSLLSPSQTIALMGASITLRNWDTTNGNQTFPAWGFFTLANILLGQRLKITKVAATPGVGTGYVLGVHLPQVLAMRSLPGWIGIGGDGVVNDVNAATEDTSGDENTPGSTIWNLYQIYLQARAVGMRVIMFTATPFGATSTDKGGSTATVLTAVQKAMQASCNKWIKSAPSIYPGLIAIDTHAAMVYASSGLPDPVLCSDFNTLRTHPNKNGGVAQSMLIANAMNQVIPDNDTMALSQLDAANVLANPLMAGIAGGMFGGATGVVADSWKVNLGGTVPTTVCRKVSRRIVGCFAGAQAWQPSHAYAAGSRVFLTAAGQPWNGFVYHTVAGGVSAGAQPTNFSTALLGTSLDNGSITWVCQSISPQWQASHNYNVGDKVMPSIYNGLVYVCTVAGVAGAAEPTWGAIIGGTTADNTVTWKAYPYADDKIEGDWQEIQVTGGAGVGTAQLYQDSLALTPSVNYVAECEIEAEIHSGIYTWQLQLGASGMANAAYCNSDTDTTTEYRPGFYKGRLRTPPFALSATPGTGTVSLLIGVMNGGKATVRMSRARLMVTNDPVLS